jgi:hypothetical protein
MSRCASCGSNMSPWEVSPCPVQVRKKRPTTRLSIADAAVYVLEGSEVPLHAYDIERGIVRELGERVNRGSLNVSLANDQRFCWAGRGIYGLARHGIYPGPRNLAGVARFFVWCNDGAMSFYDLSFAMKYAGYRFSEQSLNRVSDCDSDLCWGPDGTITASRSPQATRNLRLLGFAPDHRSFLELAEHCKKRIAKAAVERRRRLRSVRLDPHPPSSAVP